jgi:hypothetical protein
MDNNKHGTSENLSPFASEILTILSRVRLMLWAGDYDRARAELTQLDNEQVNLINHAMGLRSEVIQNERRSRKYGTETPDNLQLPLEGFQTTRGPNKTQGKIRIAAEAAKSSFKIIAPDEQLFTLSSIAAILSKIDKRISEVKGEKPIFRDQERQSKDNVNSEVKEQFPSFPVVETLEDSESGFRYMQIQKDDNHWEWRGYRPIEIRKGIEQIRENFSGTENLNLVLFDHAVEANEPTWPYRFRGFTSNAFIEVTIFDPNRILIEIAANQHVNPVDYLKAIFTALT